MDTLDLAEGKQMAFSFMTEKNSERVERQKRAPITVIIGNPPYNVGQLNENDNNKNRKYEVIEQRIRNTYTRDSKATLTSALHDAYVKFFRWASDRLQGRDGIVCFVSNNGFLESIAFDGFRKHLAQDFNLIYHFDFKGNARTTGEQRRREGGNIFDDQIRVGVGITILARVSNKPTTKIYYHGVHDYLKGESKRQHLASLKKLSDVDWKLLIPDTRQNWIVLENRQEFDNLTPLGTKEAKSSKGKKTETIFKVYSTGSMTGRDDVVYDFDRDLLLQRVEKFCEDYNSEVDRYKRQSGKVQNIDDFVKYHIKWSDTLKNQLRQGNYVDFNSNQVRIAFFRPFIRQFLYQDSTLVDRRGLFKSFLPSPVQEQENKIICCTNHSEIDFVVQITNLVPDVKVGGRLTQCFPFYVYDEDGSNRRENITDWALKQFRDHYNDPNITKWDIFYYVYAVLHHPDYRERYKDNLKRDLPRIPFVGAPSSTESPSPSVGEGLGLGTFRAFATAGQKLANLHLNYETLTPYPLEYVWKAGKPASFRVEKMRLTKEKTALAVNDVLTLKGIPAVAFEYRLGNRSALDWVIDQYQVKKDSRSGITSDPNRYSENEAYIVELVGRVVRVSVETVEIVKGLPGLS